MKRRFGLPFWRMLLTSLLIANLLGHSLAAAQASDPPNTEPPDQADQDTPAEPPPSQNVDTCWANIPTARFNDTATLSAESRAAIDCIYHYGITRGTSAATYSPSQSVTRLQMALFLARASKLLGLPLADQAKESFADLASASPESKLAVAQLNELGIARGYTAEEFGPANNIQRVHMAHFLARILRRTDVSLPNLATYTTRVSQLGDVSLLNRSARTDISLMLQLKIMDPVTPETFAPNADVTREDMALFLARTMQVVNVAPVSLELSLSSASLLVGGAATATVRALKPDGSPYPGLLIDLFADFGWRLDHLCNLDPEARVNGADAGTSEDCEIDIGDPRTNANGEVTVGLTHNIHNPEVVLNRIYAWTGRLGEQFHNTEVPIQVSKRFEWEPIPTQITTTEPINVAFGVGVSVVAQLVGPNSAGQRMVMMSRSGGVLRVIRVEYTNENGSVSFGLPGLAKPNRTSSRYDIVDEEIQIFWDRNSNSKHDGPAELSTSTTLYWG
ncbi:MAG: S-layer homology domain-containing protein [Acidimicrobiia bacterium]|nr:S-layer homology domain-containing protein [Acidimicrobiia bacterium]